MHPQSPTQKSVLRQVSFSVDRANYFLAAKTISPIYKNPKQTIVEMQSFPPPNNDDESVDSSSSSIVSDDISPDLSSKDEISEKTDMTDKQRKGRNSSGDDEVKQIEKLAQRETRGVQIWRILIALLLLVTGAAVSVGTYTFLNREITDDGESEFILFTNTIADSAHFHIHNVFEANRALSREITALALSTNQTFPFCTIDTYEAMAMAARERGGIEYIAMVNIVQENQRKAWEAYTVEHQGWFNASQKFFYATDKTTDTDAFVTGPITPFIYDFGENQTVIRSDGPGPYAPIWHVSPPAYPFYLNLDGFPYLASISKAGTLLRDFVFGPTDLTSAYVSDVYYTSEGHNRMHQGLDANFDSQAVTTSNFSALNQPHAWTAHPVFDGYDETSNIVGWLWGVVTYDSYLYDLLPEGVDGIYVVIDNQCNDTYTYILDGRTANFLGEGDLHDRSYDRFERKIEFYEEYENPELARNTTGQCIFTFHVYPSAEYDQLFVSNTPVIFTACVATTFGLMALAFFMFDFFVRRRNQKVIGAAARSNAIVSSLFPSNVRDRLFADDKNDESGHGATPAALQTKSNLRSFLSNDGMVGFQQTGTAFLKAKPIADLFPECTVLFADIVGFTAWSSVREPAQVFMLLETVYQAFDEIARKRRVFKVETVGDCYVAVCGLPDARKDHAVVMARFARDCLLRMHTLTKQLEVTLGPDTGDLTMRMGLHSGPVTAGVLRGERSRFQLFGDTVNTAARMESTGLKDKIQVSQETAELLLAHGKGKWLVPREDKVFAKGKGEMQTLWLAVDSSSDSASVSLGAGNAESSCSTSPEIASMTNEQQVATYALASGKERRLVEWNVDVLLRLLRQIVAKRIVKDKISHGKSLTNGDTVRANGGRDDSGTLQRRSSDKFSGSQFATPSMITTNTSFTVLDEVKEIITLPKFDPIAARQQQEPDTIELDEQVTQQMRDYVANVAAMYRDNPFHNFEHASHVTMSVVKLMSRIVAPSDLELDKPISVASTLHDHTYGITSDPLTQFACVFSALIHDVDHQGVPNAVLVKENNKLAAVYKNKSVAEQNSVDLAWDLLEDECYDKLRATIYESEEERQRFRQLVVNSVMATDIVDKELKALRNKRWEKAFTRSSDGSAEESEVDAINRKATIVIEHLIQASDVAHTMQHWHIYRKWNERFFQECYRAYRAGRTQEDPSETWYSGEIGFFDFYIIPLAKKLKECGVFGVSSDEYLNYAIKNREEWAARGYEVVNEMKHSAIKLYNEQMNGIAHRMNGSISTGISYTVDTSDAIERSLTLEEKLQTWKIEVNKSISAKSK